MLDFHSHILPFIDDGAKDISMALEMLMQSKEQNVEKIIATPHFSFEEMDVEKFIEQRNKSAQMLETEAENRGISIPRILLGAEVYLTPGISDREGLELLCIEGTKCILVELPSAGLDEWVYNELYKIRTRELVPVLAHLERYVHRFKNEQKVTKLLAMEVAVQINADNLLRIKYRRIISKLLANSRIVVLGSDAHNTTFRKTKISAALKKVRCRYGQKKARELQLNSMSIITESFEF